MFCYIAFLTLLTCTALAMPTNRSDEVHILPGLTQKLNFRHYSGYLKGNSTNNLFHYWFVESQSDPKNDPVLLWLNGGPGCSSLDGMLTENGPFRLQPDGITLKLDSNSWNRKANVLYLEAPVGVGFSFNTKKDPDCGDDDTAALDNYAALQNFFKKYPEFSKNEFFITGESYAAIFVSTLTKLTVDGSSQINLKGFSIGNGLLNVEKNYLSAIFHYYGHGLIDFAHFENIAKNCCNGTFDMRKCKKSGDKCYDAISSFTVCDPTTQMCPNPYNIYQKKPLISRGTVNKYLNQESVRKALHIDSRVGTFYVCQGGYTSRYARLAKYNTLEETVKYILKHKRGLIYNGDFDIECNFLGAEWFIADLGLPVVQSKTAYSIDGYIAGYKTKYQNLTFATVMGAGHMVPTDKPETIYNILREFIGK